ncbi:hypothetical protein ACKKBF_B10780 [Auxenochlorella protothecoides x Auxenochlorella symbiontica]|uniref:N-acetyltransferase ECO1 n=2 Tax=Auxenochlorella protothecoides TaxID=3075 RepID=A0A1D2A1D2_AUXPR
MAAPICFTRKRPRPVAESIPVASPQPALPTASSAAPRNGASATLRQSFLDLGQRSFHFVQCPSCGLTYSPGQPDDEALHRQHHAKACRPAVYRAGKGHTTVWSDADASIIQVPHDASQAQTLTAMLAREMGLDAAWLGRTRPRLWLYVVQESKHVLGAVWAERRLVRLAAQPSDDHPTQGHSPPGHSHVGVRAVWVRASARRRGVASRLLEAVLGVDAALSCRLPRGRLAFTDPTADGLAFARAFLGQAGAFEPPRYTDTGVQAE